MSSGLLFFVLNINKKIKEVSEEKKTKSLEYWTNNYETGKGLPGSDIHLHEKKIFIQIGLVVSK